MSGTAALAAARKRRANPQSTNQPQYQSPNQPIQNQMATIKEELPKATNPTMLLMQHNMLIQKLQKEVALLKDIDNSKASETDYKSEYLGLLEEMKEMKKVLLKVQSFSMETNLEVMKLKRITETSHEKIDLSSITVTNDIDSITEHV
jgi:hypothetical protein